jgi:hypothetical protein
MLCFLQFLQKEIRLEIDHYCADVYFGKHYSADFCQHGCLNQSLAEQFGDGR